MGEKIIKLDDTETEENEFDQYKSPISKNTIDKIRVSNSFLLVNNILNISVVTKIIKN